MIDNYNQLPKNLPIPQDDGACNHLEGMDFPDIVLQNTKAEKKSLLESTTKKQIIYFFPMMGKPGIALPENWNSIPGARGCTPQSMAIQKNIAKITKYSAKIIGISTQSPKELLEAKTRIKLNYELFSDENLVLCNLLSLPSFQIKEKKYIKRLTLIIKNTKIQKCFYPIFPSDKHIFEILDWLEKNDK